MAGSEQPGVSAAPPEVFVEVSEAAVLWKVTLRLIPFLFLLYTVNILDRVNVGFARLQMVDDLQLSETVYAFGSGIFYAGYLIFEVPSNLILHRTGARVWIARIVMSWGLTSMCMIFVTGPWSFYFLRFMLGVAEAGFFPGIILYLSYWFPARERARAVAVFMAASPIAGMLGGPLSGAILQFLGRGTESADWLREHWPNAAPLAALLEAGAGWQWLFLLEGLPAVVLGFLTLFWLTDRPEHAHWLTPDERTWLSWRMHGEELHRRRLHGQTLLQVVTDPRIWLLIALYFTIAMGSNTFGFYHPKLLQDHFPKSSKLTIGFLAAIPSALAVVGMVVNGIHSDRTGERRLHVAVPAFLAAGGWLTIAFADTPLVALVGLSLAHFGTMSMLPTFWTLPTAFLTGAAAAGGIALINSVANLGGLLGPSLFGLSMDLTGSYTTGLLTLAGAMVLGGILALCVRHDSSLDKATPAT